MNPISIGQLALKAGAVPMGLLAALVHLSTLGPSAETSIKTPIVRVEATWAAAMGAATLEKAREMAERERARVQTLPDPFTPLANLPCDARLAKGERVVWEDDALMALVDFGNRGAKLLVVPKRPVNFPTGLTSEEQAHTSRIAAATCDALMTAAGDIPSDSTPSCRIEVHPPTIVSLRQLHIHVEARTRAPATVDDAFLRRAAAHLRSEVKGNGCF